MKVATKVKMSTKTKVAVALIAGGVVLSAALAGTFILRRDVGVGQRLQNLFRRLPPGYTPGYTPPPPGYTPPGYQAGGPGVLYTPIVTLAVGSPSGMAVPGMGEIFRFNMTTDSHGGKIAFHQLMFKLTSTDLAGTDWNTCGAIDQAAKWELTDLSDPGVALDGASSWTFLTFDGSPCVAGSDVKFAMLNLDGSVSIPSGQSSTFKLRLDTTGASPADDDSARIDMPSEVDVDVLATPRDSIRWEDAAFFAGVINTGVIRHLPVTGGTLVF